MLNARKLLAAVLALLVAFTSVLAVVPSAKAEAITTIVVYIGKNPIFQGRKYAQRT